MMAFFFKSSVSVTGTEPITPQNQTFGTSDPLDTNTTSNGQEECSKCNECGFRFKNERYREDHRRWHEHVRSKNKHSASSCTTGNPKSSGSTRDHERYISDSKGNFNFTREVKKEMTEDVEEVGGTSQQEVQVIDPQVMLKPFACEYCGWRFVLKKDMVHHVRTHTGEKPYACSECDKRFSRAHSLTQHMRLHNDESKSFSCEKCPKQFWTKSRYIAHCNTVHNQQTNSSAATLEARSSDEAGSFHVEIEGTPKESLNVVDTSPPLVSPTPSIATFEDSVVGYSNTGVNTTSELTSQASTTITVPFGGGKRGIRFTCQYCGWGFWDKKDKKQHEWTHTGHKPYRCTECDKSFSRTYTLKLHMRSHTGEKPYSCPYCDKTFAGSSSLRLHTNVHTKVHRHKCTMCSMSFKRMADFKDHQREHLNSDPVLFARCYSSSSQSENLPSDSNKDANTNDVGLPLPVSLSLAEPIPEPSASQDKTENVSQDTLSLGDIGVSAPVPLGGNPIRPDATALSSQHNVNTASAEAETLPHTSEKLQDTDRDALINMYSKLISGPKRKREARFMCLFCDKGFHDKKDCRQHENTHTGYKPYECNVCGKKLSRHYSLKVHMMSHTGNKPYQCRYCNATYRDRSGRRTHELTHGQTNKYECKLCVETFEQFQSFAGHLRAHEKEIPELFNEFYPDGFEPQGKDEYLPQVKEESLLDCSHETALYDSISAGTSHSGRIPQTNNVALTAESEIQPITKQKDVNSFKEHDGTMALKDYRRPLRFNCSFCTQRFRDKKDWRQHENTHTGFKPYSCKLCGKKLSRQYSLKKHMLMHSGEKPIACPHCRKTFRDRSGLASHLKYHHPWVLHRTCCICKTTHKEFDDLEKHLRDSHADVVKTIAKEFLSKPQTNKAPAYGDLQAPRGKRASLVEQMSFGDVSDQMNPEENAVRYLSKRNQQIDPQTATAINNWLKVNGRKGMSGRPKFECNFCGKGFGNRKDWQQHENSHTGYKPYTCEVCGKKLSRLHSLKLHLLTHSKVFPYVCRICNKGFKRKMSLVKHEASTECKMPDSSAKTSKCIEEGESSHTDYQVPNGPFFFKHESDAVLNEEPRSSLGLEGRKVNKRRHQCTYCGWRFSDPNVFRRHSCRQRRVLGKTHRKQISCQYCQEVFATKTRLEMHLPMCSLLCKLCNKGFKQREELELHLRLHKDNLKGDTEEPPKSVPVSASKDQEPGSHGPVHTDQMSAQTSRSASNLGRRRSVKRVVATCRVCHKNFTHKYALKLHLMMHASEVKYECSLCSKHFSSKKALREHTKSHVYTPFPEDYSETGRDASNPTPVVTLGAPVNQLPVESVMPSRVQPSPSETSAQAKPHRCMYCGWGFWMKNDCINHERTHTGEKPYLCETCGKSFARSYSLKLHTFTHGGDKPFRCSFCNKGFTCKAYVRVHERTHTRGHPNTCKTCGELFPNSTSLSIHEQSCRIDEYEPHGLNPFVQASLSMQSNFKGNFDFFKDVPNTDSWNTAQPQSRKRFKSKSRGICSFCGWQFCDIGRMQRHQYWHRKRHSSQFKASTRHSMPRDRQPLKCSMCSASFGHPVVLKMHLRAHTGEKPYQCKTCSAAFSRYPLLSRHQETNHDMFHCQYCTRYIKGKHPASRHRRTCRIDDGAGFRKSTCHRQCDGRTFRGRRAENFHSKLVHRRVCAFSCARCHKGIATYAKLKRHLDRCPYSQDSLVSINGQLMYAQVRSPQQYIASPRCHVENFEGTQVSKIVSSNEVQGWIQLKDLDSEENQQCLIKEASLIQ